VIKIIDPFDLLGPFAVMIIIFIIIFVIVFVIIIFFVIKMFTGGSKRSSELGEGISPDNPYSAKYYDKKEKEKEVTIEICPYCGEKIAENLKICPQCGQDIN
jgi:uncharacterized membrane protein YvbJ